MRCSECEREIGTDDTLYRVKRIVVRHHSNALRLVPMCEDCRPEPYAHVTIVNYRGRGEPSTWESFDSRHSYLEPEPCEECGRPVVNERRAHERKYTTCDWRCRRKVYRQKRKERKAQQRQDLACETCGDTFAASRSDTKYCSDACKQKAYRQRKREA